jgi:hypothetical protein
LEELLKIHTKEVKAKLLKPKYSPKNGDIDLTNWPSGEMVLNSGERMRNSDGFASLDEKSSRIDTLLG